MTAPPLVQAADELLGFLRANGRSACLIGGIVVSRWGEPRATKDVDATVLVDFAEEAAVLDLLLSKFESRDPNPVPRAELGRLTLTAANLSAEFWQHHERHAAWQPIDAEVAVEGDDGR